MNTSNDTGDKITPKPAFQGSIDMVIWAIIAIQIIVAVYGFAVLPDTVPIHWGINGQANGYGHKWMGTFLYPPPNCQVTGNYCATFCRLKHSFPCKNT